MLSNEELKRYSRHIIMSEVGLEGQEKLKKAKVLVVGAGGLGSPILQYLTAAGIGTIGIVDFDTVSESNLQRQIMFDTRDLGKSKAMVAAEKMKFQNPFVDFRVFEEGIHPQNALEIIKEFDLVVDGSDNFPTRYMLNDACILLNKPYVFGAIYKFYGQVSVFNYKNGPSYRCLFPEQPKDSDSPNCSTIGVIGVIPGIIGSIQAGEAIKIILEKEGVLSGKLLQMDTLNFQVDQISFPRNETNFHLTELGEYGTTCDIDTEVTKVNSIHPRELHEKLKQNELVEVIDIREEFQFNDYRIESKLLEADDILEAPSILPKEKMVVILCEFGEKSEAVVEYLGNNENMQNVFNLHGGLQAWLHEGFEVIRD